MQRSSCQEIAGERGNPHTLKPTLVLKKNSVVLVLHPRVQSLYTIFFCLPQSALGLRRGKLEKCNQSPKNEMTKLIICAALQVPSASRCEQERTKNTRHWAAEKCVSQTGYIIFLIRETRMHAIGVESSIDFTTSQNESHQPSGRHVV